MKKILITLTAVLMMACQNNVEVPNKAEPERFVSESQQQTTEIIPNQYIVTLKSDLTDYEIATEKIKVKKKFNKKVFHGYHVEMDAVKAEKLKKNPKVLKVEPDQVIHAASVQEGAPWHLDRIDQPNVPLDTVYNYTGEGEGVDVYIIDSGINTNHVDFGGRASLAYDFRAAYDPAPDCLGHGTHVAGIVGSNTYGVAKKANLKALRVLACDGSGNLSDMISAVSWIATNKTKPSVVNISIALSGNSFTLDNAINNLVDLGVPVVVAAGNFFRDACLASPASAQKAITVGATVYYPTGDAKAGYSNTGKCVDIFAPGHSILSTYNGDTTSFVYKSGTSMASPVVAGIVAIYMGQNPTASSASIAAAILGSGVKGIIGSMDAESPNLFAQSSVAAAVPTPTPTPVTTPTPVPVCNASYKTLSGAVANTVNYYTIKKSALTIYTAQTNSNVNVALEQKNHQGVYVPIAQGSNISVVSKSGDYRWSVSGNAGYVICTNR